MFRRLTTAALAVLLQACAGTYVAGEYPLDNDRIPAFDVKGDVAVHNAFSEPRPVTVGGMEADLTQITATFAEQLEREIIQNGTRRGDGDKEIEVKVSHMNMVSRYVYMEGIISVALALGNGESVSFEKRNGSPADVQRVLNGTIARAVMESLEHPQVRAYLAE